MRVKTKLEASPTKQEAKPSAEASRSKAGSKTAPSVRRHSVESRDAENTNEILPVSFGVHSSGSHSWRPPSKNFKAGGDWVSMSLYLRVIFAQSYFSAQF